MGLDDRDYMRRPESSGARRPSGWSLDRTLVLGVVVAGLVLSAFIIRGFEAEPSGGFEPISMYEAYHDANQIQLDVNEATRDELLMIPLVSERIADGIIAARPLRQSEELLNVKGIGEVNMEIILMYLYGFQDLPTPRFTMPSGVPDV